MDETPAKNQPTPAELEAILAATARIAEMADAYEKATPDLLERAVLDHLRTGLSNLRAYIESPTEDRISWDFPFVELTYPVEWDGETHTGPLPRLLTAEDVVDGAVPETKIFEVLYELRQVMALSLLTRGVVEWREAAKADAEGLPSYLLPEDVVEALDKETGTRATENGVEGPPEAVARRREMVNKLADPVSIGPYELEAAEAEARHEVRELQRDLMAAQEAAEKKLERLRDIRTEEELAVAMDALQNAQNEKLEAENAAFVAHMEAELAAREIETYEPTAEEWEDIEAGATHYSELEKGRANLPPPITFSATSDDGATLEGYVVGMVYPLVVDADARRAWFTVGVGLVFTKGSPRNFSEKDLAAFWDTLTKPDTTETPTSETSETYTKSTRSAPQAGPPQARLLRDSRVRLPALSTKVVSFLTDAKLWRNWEKVKTWDALVLDEIDRIREIHGEAAFVEAPDIGGPLLRRQWNAKGEDLVELTKEAEAELIETAGRVGFRRKQRDPDGIDREYLVKRFPAGKGSITVSWTWYGEAFPLSHEARELKEKDLRETIEKESSALFPAPEVERRKRDQALGLLGSMKDAARIAPRLLAAFYQQRANPIRLPAYELYTALLCEKDQNRFARVRAAIESLRRLEFEYEGKDLGPGLSGRVRGSFVLEIGDFEGRGRGSHKEDGVFVLTLSDWAIGCLNLWPHSRVKDPRGLFVDQYDFAAKLPPDAKAHYIQGFSAYNTYLDDAAGLTPPQRRLQQWMEHQVTRQSDAAEKGRESHRLNHNAATAHEPRVYTSDFCPHLEKGRNYHAALGHTDKKYLAEKGWKLQGKPQAAHKAGGAKQGQLLDVLGYDLPPGAAHQARNSIAVAALKDLRAVVEEALGGRVVGRRGNVWLSLHEAERLRAEELLKEVLWYLFLPEGWYEARVETFNEKQKVRHEKGEIDRLVLIAPTTTASGLDALDLRERLHATRQERKLNSEAVGKVFGVSKMTVSNWERGRNAGGAPIPEDLQPLILRWIETGKGPTEDELKALAARRRGGKKRASP